MYERLEDPKAYENHQSTIDLLYWVLITLRDPHIKSVNKNLVSIYLMLNHQVEIKEIKI